MINAYAGRERPRGWSFLAHHWELIIVSLADYCASAPPAESRRRASPAADSLLLPCPNETKKESMARKIKAKLILQQLAAGTTRNAIARSLGVSKH